MPVAIDESHVDELLKGITIPSPPQIVVDLQFAMYDPCSDINSIADIIGKDPGLSGAVLKAVHSPLYSLPQQITSIREAAMCLGVENVSMLVNTLCLRNECILESISKDSQAFLNHFWDSCGDIASIAAMVAEKTQFKQYRDDAYLLGLFHNAGIALLAQRFDHYPSVIQSAYGEHEGKRIVDVENEMLDTNHAVVGYYIAKSWKLPTWIADAIAKHHSVVELIQTSTDERLKALVAILKSAEHISGFYKTVASQDHDHEWNQIHLEVMSYLDVTQDDYDDVASQALDMGIGSGEIFY